MSGITARHRLAMRTWLAACAVAIAAPALATGNLGCEVDDAAMTLTVASGVSRGLGEPIFGFRGEMTLKDQAISEELRMVEFDRSDLMQYWLEGQELRLRIYSDLAGKTAQGSVELVVKTAASDDEGAFVGRYRLTVFDTAGLPPGDAREFSFEGPVSCFAG